MRSGKIIRDPLVHFLAIGLGFFLLFNLVSDDKWQVDDQIVVVDERALLEFMQFQAKAFDSEHFTDQMASFTSQQMQQLIDDYIREEVLYREAKNLGMELNDNLIRRRMVGKIEYLTRSMTSQLINASQAQLKALYQERKDEYYIEPAITFTHVFFDTEKHGLDQARELAISQLDEFITKSMPTFSEAAKYTDRFPYHLNYVKRSRSFIQSHFGESFTQDLFRGETNNNNWFGPIQSAYGYHLVLMLEQTEGRYPPIGEVIDELSEEFKRQQTLKLQNQAIQSLIDTYQVVIDLPAAETK
jgi:parvulin-like peptidyl-prolyl isomerase